MDNKKKLKAMSDIIPLLEQGHTYEEVRKMFKPKIGLSTIFAYAKRLREAGHTLPGRKAGRKAVPLE